MGSLLPVFANSTAIRLSRPLLFALLACLVSPCGLSTQHCAAAEPKAKKVLLVGIDGLRSDALQAANTPALDGLIAAGAVAENTLILGPRKTNSETVSGPGWSSILTGVWADKHGVNDNKFQGDNYKRFPHFFVRLKEQRPAAKTASFVTWAPIAEKIVAGADVNEIIPISGDKANDFARSEKEVAGKVEAYLQIENPDALFVYFGMVDSMGHTKGFHPKVPEYIQAIEYVDQCLGQVLAAVAARKTFAAEDWLVLVTTDHGGRGRDHSGGHLLPEIRQVFLIVSGPAAAQGKIEEQTFLVDAPVTALTHLGVKIDPAWKLDGRPVGLSKAE